MSVINDTSVRRLLLLAWRESQPATDAAHEEGGFILRAENGILSVERWPRGVQDRIVVPPHSAGKRGSLTIVATFHTHPNPGDDYQQEPSLTDIRAVRHDPDLGGHEYEGEYVIATAHVYRILKSSQVELVGETNVVIGTA